MNIATPEKLQRFFYNYVLAAEKLKVSSDERQRLKKIADVLVEIADELDATDPQLAAEADSLLQDLIKEAGCSEMMMDPSHMHSEKCMPGKAIVMVTPEAGPPMMGGQYLMDKEGENLPEELLSVEELTDPDIKEISEPEPEFDEVSLDDLDDRLGSLKFRIADKSRREVLQKAKEHALKAREYYEAYKRYRDKTHGIFDEAGEALRLKAFD